MKKQIVWYGPPYSYSGYATHNRCMMFALHKLGWDIRLIPTELDIPKDLIGAKLLQHFVSNTHIKPDENIVINLIPPPALPLWGSHTILFTTLESKTVHEGFMRRCKQFDEVWVPCQDNFKSMIKAGFKRKLLHLCPEGVYTDFWNPKRVPLEKYRSRKFTFFYNGDWSYRKGLDILIPAYCKAFLPTDNVRLLLLTHYQGCNDSHSKKKIQDEFQEILQKNSIFNHPEIKFISKFIPDPLMPNLYNCSDVFVFPSRGEAWGLPAIQSMSCEKPVITTNWGGQTDYCLPTLSYLIDVENFDIIDDKTILVVDFYKDQLFAFPSEKHLTELMRHCQQHPDEVKLKGKISRQFIENNYTWDHAGKIADKLLTRDLRKGATLCT